MTSIPAKRLDLKHRGKILDGFWADLVIFNPDTVIDKATYENPHQAPIGIPYVVVNGQLVLENGRIIDVTPGRVLKPSS